jgi:hypothetical protein
MMDMRGVHFEGVQLTQAGVGQRLGDGGVEPRLHDTDMQGVAVQVSACAAGVWVVHAYSLAK